MVLAGELREWNFTTSLNVSHRRDHCDTWNGKIGDCCLYTSGIFPPSRAKSVVGGVILYSVGAIKYHLGFFFFTKIIQFYLGAFFPP